jgi:hypothetical protein
MLVVRKVKVAMILEELALLMRVALVRFLSCPFLYVPFP